MELFAVLAVKLDVPPTVTTPMSVMLPVFAVIASGPLTFDALRMTPTFLAMVAAPPPAVLTPIEVVNTLAAVIRLIVAPPATVVKLAAPPTFSTPLWVILPPVDVAVRSRPTFDAWKSRLPTFTRVTSPVPVV